ncbi:MAG TPA: GNAT family N-acetyltransferase [Gammaproteobacteria bacterium]|nr:GNAT family N-acetyltransferase [Gammaproteobacteria bacterium]
MTETRFPAKQLDIVDVSVIDRLQADWHDLMEHVDQCELFASADWFKAWSTAFGENKQQQLACYRENGKLKALMPMVTATVRRNPLFMPRYDVQPEDKAFVNKMPFANVLPVRQISAPINLQSGAMRGAWLASSGVSESFMHELLTALSKKKHWDVMLFSSLPVVDADIVCAQAISVGLSFTRDSQVREVYKSQVLNWDEYWAGRTRHFRKRYREASSRLRKMGSERFAVLTGPKEVALGLAQLFQLARESWKFAGRKDQDVHLPLTEQTEVFYRALCDSYAAKQQCQLYMMYLDEEPVAGMVSFTEGNRSFAMQTYYHPKVAKASPGRFLFRHMSEWCCQNGKTIDWNGNSAIVKMFANDFLAYDRVTVFNTNLYPRALKMISNGARVLQAAKLRVKRNSKTIGEDT